MSTTSPVQLQESSPAKACSDLPEGWVLPRIGEVLEVKYGKGLKKNNRISGPVPVYGSNGIVGEHNTSLTEGPAIILGRKGTVGAVHFSNTPCWAIDTTYYIDDFNGLVPEYLLCALKILNLAGLDTSTAIPGLNRNDLYNRHIPLPPIAEQKRIVAKVEQLVARVNAARERLAKVPEILKRFRQSILAAACSGRLTADWRQKNPDVEPANALLEQVWTQRKRYYDRQCAIAKEQGQRKPKKPTNLGPKIRSAEKNIDTPLTWFWTSFEDIASVKKYSMSSGPFGSALGLKDYQNDGVPVVRGQNIQDGRF
ncbi:MAG: hypothetical protein DRH10_01230, partial [Deltaproteobacteria bacterium]